MPDLEQELAGLGEIMGWPATPALATRVAVRLTATPKRMSPWFGRRWALAVAAVLLAAASLFAYAPSRDAIAGWLNLHTVIERIQNPPSPTPLPSGPLGKRLGLGTQTTLAAAQSGVAWKIAIPVTLGNPDEVYVQEPADGPPQGEVTLVYRPRAGIPATAQTGVGVLITEARGTVDANLFGKMLGPNDTLEQVAVNGHQGYWITGQPNVFFFIAADGTFRNETMRLAANTLILDDGGTIVRIEGNLTRAQVLQIAGSL